MPYTIAWTERGIIWTYSHTVTAQEMIDSNMSIYGDPRFDELRYQLVDLTEVTDSQFDTMDMRQLAHFDIAAARTNPRIRVALVARDGAGLEIAESYLQQTDKSPWEHQLFDTMEAALVWAKKALTPPPFNQ